MDDKHKVVSIEQEKTTLHAVIDRYALHEAQSIAMDRRSENNGIESTPVGKKVAKGSKAPPKEGQQSPDQEKNPLVEEIRHNYKMLKEVKEDENTLITRRTVGDYKSVTLLIKYGGVNERITFNVDEVKGIATPAVSHISRGGNVEREVVTHPMTDITVSKRIEARLMHIHARQAERAKKTAIAKELNNDKVLYKDDLEIKRSILSAAYSTLSKEEAIKRHPELAGLYKLESAAIELARNGIGNQKNRGDFVSAIRDRSISELAKSNCIQKSARNTQKSPGKTLKKKLEL